MSVRVMNRLLYTFFYTHHTKKSIMWRSYASSCNGVGVTTLNCMAEWILDSENCQFRSCLKFVVDFKLRPSFPCSRGLDILCLLGWVGASTRKCAMGSDIPVLTGNRRDAPSAQKGSGRAQSVSEKAADFTKLFSPPVFAPLCSEQGVNRPEPIACGAEAKIDGNAPPLHIQLHRLHSKFLNT
jgi:hypothetical protein